MKSCLFPLTLLLCCCARIGTPSGGPKDETPPKMLKASPPNESVNFKERKFRVYFDEYIRLKDLYQHLIISPPLKHRPKVYPLSTAKYLEVQFSDTLKPTATYRFDFGGSVVDNNEGNPYGDLQYVFSTGPQLDSLQVSGVITDALQREYKPELHPVAMLYRLDSTYIDSSVYRRIPDYAAFSDTTGAFRIPFVKAGTYRLYAMTDSSKDLRFQPKTDEIAFASDTLHLEAPDSTQHTLRLFKEQPPFRVLSPEQPQKGLISFPFQGDSRSTSVELTPPRPGFKTLLGREAHSDTLHYWHPFPAGDSLHFYVYHRGQIVDTLLVRVLPHLGSTKVEKLKLEPEPLASPTAAFVLHSDKPILSIDSSRVQLLRDSLPLPFSEKVDNSRMRIRFTFDKKLGTRYRFQALPGAVIGFFGRENDSLNIPFSLPEARDFAQLTLELSPPLKAPFFLDLFDEKDALLQSRYIPDPKRTAFHFKYLKAGTYYFRIRVDKNRNKRWDSGNAYQCRQPEPVYFYPDNLQLRAFWKVTEKWKLPD